MAKIAQYAYLGGECVDIVDAKISIASSAVLYGLSIYTVFFAKDLGRGTMQAFRLPEHYDRLVKSSRMIGMDNLETYYSYDDFLAVIRQLVQKNDLVGDHFFRFTVHAVEILPGVRTSGLTLSLSAFVYEAKNILPRDDAHIKTSLWRRTADCAIPARAKVNGAYVNSALAKQEALDAGCDDCLFLNQHGFVSELSAANIFLIKEGVLITPDASSDILEGITRKTIIELALEHGYRVIERKVALTEVYTADEVFACGTSAFVAPITKVDGRKIGIGESGPMTLEFRSKLENIHADTNSSMMTRL